MTKAELEQRLRTMERELAQIKERIGALPAPSAPWWHKIWGRFADDESFPLAVKLGREYRESLRPRPKRKKRNGKTGNSK